MDISPQKIISLNLLQNSIHMMKHSSKKTKEKAEYIQEKVTNIQCSNYYVSHSNVDHLYIPDIFESSWIRTVVFENALPSETGQINRGFAYGNLF